MNCGHISSTHRYGKPYEPLLLLSIAESLLRLVKSEDFSIGRLAVKKGLTAQNFTL